MRFLVAAVVSFAFLSSIRAVPAPTLNQQIAQMIAELGSDNFRMREAAHLELLQIGPDAAPALREAIARNPSEESIRRIKAVLQTVQPIFEAHSNGWHWVHENLAQGQTFRPAGTSIQKLRLRVARMNKTQPSGALAVEIRDSQLTKVYLRGHIPAADSSVEFRWHSVKLDHVADVKEGDEYMLIFHSRDTASNACWAVNAAYKDVYPHGQHSRHADEDFFFEMQFGNRRTLRVGPEDENTKEKLPINSGNQGGTHLLNGGLILPGRGEVPDGEEAPAAKR
jgi:hypothetical protein